MFFLASVLATLGCEEDSDLSEVRLGDSGYMPQSRERREIGRLLVDDVRSLLREFNRTSPGDLGSKRMLLCRQRPSRARAAVSALAYERVMFCLIPPRLISLVWA